MAKPAEIQTKQNDASVEDFLAGIDDAEKQADSRTIMKWMTSAMKEQPKMWGASMIGLACYDIKVQLLVGRWTGLRLAFRPVSLICHYI